MSVTEERPEPGQPSAAPASVPDRGKSRRRAPGTEARSRAARRRESVLLVLGGVVIALLARLFVLDSYYIPSESMENTLRVDDRVIVNRLSGDLGRGEVVVFKGWDGTTTIKRVIGIGGDRVTCCDGEGRVAVNGVPLDERSYLHPDDFPSQQKFDITVPGGRLWLMGDHRADSDDSRAQMKNEFHGTISADDVIGRAVARYWPFARAGTLPVPPQFSRVR